MDSYRQCKSPGCDNECVKDAKGRYTHTDCSHHDSDRRHANDGPTSNHNRSTIDGFRTTRSAHIKAGRIVMEHGEQDERGMYWDGWNKQFRSVHPNSEANNTRRHHSRSTIDGVRATRSAHIKAGRIIPTEEDDMKDRPEARARRNAMHRRIERQAQRRLGVSFDVFRAFTPGDIKAERAKQIEIMLEAGDLYKDAAGMLRLTNFEEEGTDRGPAPAHSGSPEIKTKGNGHTNTLQANHTYPEGGGHRLAPLPPKNKGVTDAEVNCTESWFYSIVKDPWMYPNTKKTGNTRQEPDKYANRPYRAALDVTHINVFDLYFSLIYKAKRNGITIEKRVQRKLRAIFTPTHRPEEVLCDDPIEYRRVLMAICAKEPDLELWYDEEQGGWLKEEGKKSLTDKARGGIIEDHVEI